MLLDEGIDPGGVRVEALCVQGWASPQPLADSRPVRGRVSASCRSVSRSPLPENLRQTPGAQTPHTVHLEQAIPRMHEAQREIGIAAGSAR